MTNETPIDRENLKPLPVGDSEWADFAQKSSTVDKTLLLKELIDDILKLGIAYRKKRIARAR